MAWQLPTAGVKEREGVFMSGKSFEVMMFLSDGGTRKVDLHFPRLQKAIRASSRLDDLYFPLTVTKPDRLPGLGQVRPIDCSSSPLEYIDCDLLSRCSHQLRSCLLHLERNQTAYPEICSVRTVVA